MENLLCVKGRIVGKGKPLVCVPIMEKTKEAIIKEAKRLRQTRWVIKHLMFMTVSDCPLDGNVSR